MILYRKIKAICCKAISFSLFKIGQKKCIKIYECPISFATHNKYSKRHHRLPKGMVSHITQKALRGEPVRMQGRLKVSRERRTVNDYPWIIESDVIS